MFGETAKRGAIAEKARPMEQSVTIFVVSTSLKTQLIAFAVMAGSGLAMPAAAWVANQPSPRPARVRVSGATEALAVVGPAARVELHAPPPPSRHAVVTEVATAAAPPVMAPVRAPRMPVRPSPSPMRCFAHASQTLASGLVRVCDVDRTPNGRAASPFDPIGRPRELAPRTLPSPSGLALSGLALSGLAVSGLLGGPSDP